MIWKHWSSHLGMSNCKTESYKESPNIIATLLYWGKAVLGTSENIPLTALPAEVKPVRLLSNMLLQFIFYILWNCSSHTNNTQFCVSYASESSLPRTCPLYKSKSQKRISKYIGKNPVLCDIKKFPLITSFFGGAINLICPDFSINAANLLYRVLSNQ